MSSYDVRVYKILENKNAKRPNTYTVRWKVGRKPFRDTFKTRALAESFRAKLIVAQREGVAFDEDEGLPEPMLRKRRERNRPSWLQLAIAFADMRWPHVSPKERKSIADALATVTPALLTTHTGAPDIKTMRAALYGWAFFKSRRESGEPPARLAAAVKWLEANTISINKLEESATVRAALDMLKLKMDRKSPAAPNTVGRKRSILYAVLKYGVELKHFEVHPMEGVSWTPPTTDDVVDRRVVANPAQARGLLRAVGQEAPDLEAFFGSMYYAALRPEEGLHLREDEYERPKEPGAWGWLHLTGATIETGIGWGEGNETTEDRELKHRAKNASRSVPACPELCALLDKHIEDFGVGPGGRLFVTRRGPGGRYGTPTGNPIPSSTISRVWQAARKIVLTPRQQRSPLAKVAYHLRHACVSLWLNAGVPATLVAEWAGHSLAVLLKVYAKCVYGQEEAARKRIEAALTQSWDLVLPEEAAQKADTPTTQRVDNNRSE